MAAEYQNTLDEEEGPRIVMLQNGEEERIPVAAIESSGSICPEYEKRIQQDTRNALKKNGGDGRTYSLEQQRLRPGILSCIFYWIRRLSILELQESA